MSFAGIATKMGFRNIMAIPKKTVAEMKRALPSPPKVIPPELPPPVATPRQISEQAQRAGQAERRRIRRQKGRASTIFAGRRTMEPATVQQTALKQKLG